MLCSTGRRPRAVGQPSVQTSSTLKLVDVVITGCPSHAPFRRRSPGISGRCRSYLGWSAAARHFGVLSTSLRSTSEGQPLLTVLHMTVKCPRGNSCRFGHFDLSLVASYCKRHCSRISHYLLRHGRKSRGAWGESPRVWIGDVNANCPPPLFMDSQNMSLRIHQKTPFQAKMSIFGRELGLASSQDSCPMDPTPRLQPILLDPPLYSTA